MIPSGIALVLTVIAMIVIVLGLVGNQLLERTAHQDAAFWTAGITCFVVIFTTWQWKRATYVGFGPFVEALIVEFIIVIVAWLTIMMLAKRSTDRKNTGRTRR